MKLFHVDTTATGSDETFTVWQEWPTVLERYGKTNEPLARAVRVFLAKGEACVVTASPPALDERGGLVDGIVIGARQAADLAERQRRIRLTVEAAAQRSIADERAERARKQADAELMEKIQIAHSQHRRDLFDRLDAATTNEEREAANKAITEYFEGKDLPPSVAALLESAKRPT